ncbi:unnamed protein product [Bemisia tabaci]|uniref:EGF-like domain-containing protein n=1 Tax=Bemisia tabaci TaxID=7038 RepID=A0A9P0A510_BEMTA|nr:unnamed protein product [Bemisia tabaci]
MRGPWQINIIPVIGIIIAGERNCLRSDGKSMENTELGTENAELTTENAELTTENAELGTDNTELRRENTELITENTEQSAENTELSTESTELSSENTELSSENTELSTENMELNTENTELSTENTELSTENTDDIILEEISQGQIIDNGQNDPTELSPDEALTGEWIDEAVKNVAFNLRHYKFNSFDRRYFTEDIKNVTYGFFTAFPNPPLRQFHWEVYTHCSTGFLKCLKYLNEKINETYHLRKTDTATIAHTSKWRLPGNRDLINQADDECLRLVEMDRKKNKPFQGPLEKFQWQTSASYYMCWYTMQDIPNLAMLGEPCDNFANCWDPERGITNRDFRADDRKPYACAMYSFCPDPCCPKKLARSEEECWNTAEPRAPCSRLQDKACSFDPTANREQLSIIYNHWNVTCKCSNPGFRWSSKFGMCVDINECENGAQVCKNETELCMNLPGTYSCSCSLGFEWSKLSKSCIKNQFLHEEINRVIEFYSQENAATTKQGEPLSISSLVKKLIGYIGRKKIFIVEWLMLAIDDVF